MSINKPKNIILIILFFLTPNFEGLSQTEDQVKMDTIKFPIITYGYLQYVSQTVNNLKFGKVIQNNQLRGIGGYSVVFEKPVRFYYTNFGYQPLFSYARFNDSVDFEFATFQTFPDFRNAIFSNKLSFRYATFRQTPAFFSAQLPQSLDFCYVSLKECEDPIRFDLALIDTLKVKLGEKIKCKIKLNSFTDLNKVILDASKFEIVFDSTSNYDEQVGTFQQIIKKNTEMGFEDSATGFDIELQKLQLCHNYPFWGTSLIYLNVYWWDFGHDKTKIFRNTFYSWIVTFLLFFIFLPFFSKVYFPSQMSIKPTEVSSLKFNSWNDFKLRIKIALFYTSLIFFSWKMEHSEVNYRQHPWGTLVIYLIFTIGIIHLAYLAGAVLNK